MLTVWSGILLAEMNWLYMRLTCSVGSGDSANLASVVKMRLLRRALWSSNAIVLLVTTLPRCSKKRALYFSLKVLFSSALWGAAACRGLGLYCRGMVWKDVICTWYLTIFLRAAISDRCCW